MRVTLHRPRWRRLWRKVRPVDLGFAEGTADTQEGALAVLADLFIAGIEDEIGKGAAGVVAPFWEFGVEEFGTGADVGGTDAGAAECLDEGGDCAGRDALHIHFCPGEFAGLLGADALFEGAGMEGGFAPHLRPAEGDGTDAAGAGLGLVAVGVALARVGALAGLGLEDLMTVDAHRFVNEPAEAFGEAGGALFGQELQDVVQEIRIGGVGQGMFYVGCVCDTPTGNQGGPPATSFPHAERLPPGRGAAALGSLRSPSLRRTPPGGQAKGGETIYRKTFTPTSFAATISVFIF